MEGPGWKPASDETLRMPPRPRSTIAPAAACVSRTSAITFRLISRISVSMSSVWNGPNVPKPALFTRRSTWRALASTAASCFGVGEVGREHLGVRAVSTLDLLGERFEARGIAGDEHDVVTALRELPSELLADPDGRTRDQRNRIAHVFLLSTSGACRV